MNGSDVRMGTRQRVARSYIRVNQAPIQIKFGQRALDLVEGR